MADMRWALSRLSNAVKTYLAPFSFSTASIGAQRPDMLAEQVAMTTRAMWSVSGLIAAMLVLAPAMTWGHASRPFMLMGELMVAGASMVGLRRPHQPAIDTVAADARLHIILAGALGTGWAMLTTAMTGRPDANILLIAVLLQATSICIGLLLYCSLPTAFPLFVAPIGIALGYELVAAGRPAAFLALLVPVVIVILARSCFQQSDRFLAARRTDEALGQAREREFHAEREAAEQRLRHVQTLADASRRSETERRAELLTLANHFEDSVVALADALTVCTTNVDGVSSRLDLLLAGARDWAEGIAERTLEAASTTSEVDAAARSLTGAISEIAGRVEDHARSSERAHRLVGSSGDWIAAIDDEIARVVGVASVIETMTTQTKLLALNATIEAARAGDAGRGFAVVAGEVRALASQAGDASREVATGIGGVSTRMEKVIADIRDTAREIDRVADIAVSIAGAIARQRTATERISGDILSLSYGAATVRDQVADFVARADEAQGLTGEVRANVSALSAQAAKLRESSGVFLAQLRAA